MRQLDALLLILGHFETGRALCSAPMAASSGLVLTATLTLALGIGGTTAMFTLVDAVLLRPLPVAKPDQLYRVGNDAYSGVTSGLQNNFGIFSYDLYQFFRTKHSRVRRAGGISG